jgi:hypothetical protein
MSDRVLASLGTGRQEHLLRLARVTIEPYARRHGYDLELHTQAVDQSRPPPWSKIRILRRLVERYPLVVWLDADLVVVDPREDLADELAEGCFLHLVEHRHEDWRMPNTGVMLLRGGSDAQRFLDAAWELERYAEHQWWENAAVCELLGYALDPPRPVRDTAFRAQTHFISPRWNSIPDAPAHRPRIRHFPGYSLKTRAALMCAATVEAKARTLLERRRGSRFRG